MAEQLTRNNCTLRIRSQTDLGLARVTARQTAERLGFASGQCAEIVTAVSELGSNLLSHAGTGNMKFEVRGEPPESLWIITIDNGPGIQDPHLALTDGYSTCNSLGYGLGSVNRLMDQFSIESPLSDGAGTMISCCKLIRTRQSITRAPSVEIWGESRPIPGGSHNGDDFLIFRSQDDVLAGVIDGIGHGYDAHKAALAARDYITRHSHLEIPDIFSGVHRACMAGRGVVMSLIRFQETRGIITVRYGAVGNIETRLYGSRRISFPFNRGIVGKHDISPAYCETVLMPGEVIVMFSDGVRSHYDSSSEAMLKSMTSRHQIRFLLSHLAKTSDDATLLVIKAPPEQRQNK